jgi:hypothetical protein
MSIKRLNRWKLVFVMPSFIGLAAVLTALGAGFSPHHWWPVAAFLMAWAGSASYVALANRASRRRAFRLRDAPVPRGVRLRKPLWMDLDVFLIAVGIGAAFGTIAAAIGFPGVGLGIALVPAGFGLFGVFSSPFGPSSLTFDDAGLRLYIWSAQCLVPWTSIIEIQSDGPEGFVLIRLSIVDPDRVVNSVVPDTSRNRKRVDRLLMHRVGSSRAEIWLERGTGGLDGATLLRAIREAMAGRPPQMN